MCVGGFHGTERREKIKLTEKRCENEPETERERERRCENEPSERERESARERICTQVRIPMN